MQFKGRLIATITLMLQVSLAAASVVPTSDGQLDRATQTRDSEDARVIYGQRDYRFARTDSTPPYHPIIARVADLDERAVRDLDDRQDGIEELEQRFNFKEWWCGKPGESMKLWC